MAGIMPSVGQVAAFNSMLGKAGGITFPLLLKLYSNDKTPVVGDDNTDYTEVTGGGYADVEIADGGDWTVSSGDGSVAVMDDFQDFNFTGAIGGSGNVYGYYILDDNNVLVNAQRFVEPLTPVNGSLIRVKPRMELANAA